MSTSQIELQEDQVLLDQQLDDRSAQNNINQSGSPTKQATIVSPSYHLEDDDKLDIEKPKINGSYNQNNENFNISNSQSQAKSRLILEDKENTDISRQYNIPSNMMNSQSTSAMKRSSSQADIINMADENGQEDYNIAYDQDNFDDVDSNGNQSASDNMTQITDSKNAHQQNSSNVQNKKKKVAKRSQSKDVKILKTMKAYFPSLAQPEQKKVVNNQQPGNPMLSKIYGGQRSSTNSQGKGFGQHSERIIFVENRRKPNPDSSAIDYKAKQQLIENKNSQVNNSTSTITQSNKNLDQLRRNTQLPPINKKHQVQVLDQSQNNNLSPRTLNQNKILSPLSTNQQYQNIDGGSSLWSDKNKPSNKLLYTTASNDQDLFMVNGVILEGNYDTEQLRQQSKKDYERKNQDMLLKMQEKKNQEMKMIEEQRRKLQKRQQKLKNMILSQAAEVREKKQRDEENKKKQIEEGVPQIKKTPVKRKHYAPQQSNQQITLKQQNSTKEDEKYEEADEQIDEEEGKKKMDMLKKYYRSRYATFLKTIQEKNKKREEEMEIVKKKEEKKKAKLQEELGIQKVQSRFMEDVVKLSKEVSEKLVIEQQPRKKQKHELSRRGSSIAGMKSMTSTSNFNQTTTSNNDSASDIQKIYVTENQRNRSQSKSQKRAHTPKIKISKRVIVMPIDEKTEEDFEKELKAKKEAAEKIKMRQQKYLQELQDRKEKETQKMEEDRKKKEKLQIVAREQAKQNFDKIAQQPGLKEMQDKDQKKQQSEDDDETGENSEIKKKKKKVKPEGQLESFLERNNPKKVIFPNITDLAIWKKKYKVDDNVKVFICTGGYPDIKKALKKRGWVENKDTTSPCYDFKWVLKSKDIDHNILNDNQLVNHFNKAAAITTKVGLCHNLKNLIWFNNVDIDNFYPRCFDLAMQEDLDDFIEEFKGVKAESYVKQFVKDMRLNMGDKPSTVTDKILKVALKVCDKRLRELDDLIDDPNAFNSLVTDEEWAILGADELNHESLAKQKHENWLAKNEVMQQEKKRKENKEKEKEKKKKKKKKTKQVVDKQNDVEDEDYEKEDGLDGWEDEKKNENEEEDIIDDEEDDKEKVEQDKDLVIMSKHPEFKRAIKILEDLKVKYPQFDLNGDKNIWIIKPAGSSRGRGIVLYNQLVEVLDLCKQKESQYIAQKYIENSLIVKKRKFDIRQWVLVTDWNPLTVWVYQEPYYRFPASDYTDENILDRFIHLTNNSVAKYADKATVTHEIEGNMWCHDDMKSYLQEEFGWDVWEDKLKDQTNSIIINCLESVQDMFECKPGCFELFGFDLMIDDDFNMWLIEVNSSPAMDYSTPVTERLVKLVLEDTIKVVVDYAQAKKKSKVDTGLFECICKASKIVDKPISSFGLNLVCEGKKMASSKVAQY